MPEAGAPDEAGESEEEQAGGDGGRGEEREEGAGLVAAEEALGGVVGDEGERQDEGEEPADAGGVDGQRVVGEGAAGGLDQILELAAAGLPEGDGRHRQDEAE